jgi:mannitol/fructose-specific phosphotransferase system IIA component (Ntr-type)
MERQVMRLTDFLSPETIKVPLGGTTKEEILRELVEVTCRGEEDRFCDSVLETIKERERLMSSGIGQGIALPHGLWTHEKPFAGSLGIPAQPVEFGSIDSQPVEIIFLLVCNEEHTNTKLKALARISRLLHREDFRTGLAACTSSDEAMQVIVNEEARHRI